jgi:hypothetical protein
MHTDEYEISLNREIGVCRSKVASAKKELARLEKAYGLQTQQFVDGKAGVSAIPEKESARWREAAATLSVWSARLREYEELYLQHKK